MLIYILRTLMKLDNIVIGGIDLMHGSKVLDGD